MNNLNPERYTNVKQAQDYVESSRWVFSYPLIVATIPYLISTDFNSHFKELILNLRQSRNFTSEEVWLLERIEKGDGLMFRCFTRPEPTKENPYPVFIDYKPSSTLTNALTFIDEIGYEMDPTIPDRALDYEQRDYYLNHHRFFASPELPYEEFFYPYDRSNLTVMCIYENISLCRTLHSDYLVKEWEQLSEDKKIIKPLPYFSNIKTSAEYWKLPTLRDILKGVIIFRWEQTYNG